MEESNGAAAPQPEEFFYCRTVPPEGGLGRGELGENFGEAVEPKRLCEFSEWLRAEWNCC
jgi:hypothetical protein